MKIELLKEFVVLSKTLNYHVASDLLYITQPTLSKHIKDIEQELGVQLLNRDSKTVSLTEAGTVIAQKASFLLEVYQDILSSARKSMRGKLEIAVPLRYTLFSRLIAVARDSFVKNSPEIECWIKDFSLNDEPVELLSKGCDLVLNVYLPEYEAPNLKAIKLCKAKLNVWVSQGGKLADRNSVSLKALDGMVFRPASDREDYPWLTFVSRVFEEHGVSFITGDVLDDQYRLGPIDFGLVFGSEPTAMLGFNAQQVTLAEEVFVDVAAYYRYDNETPMIRDFIDSLAEHAPDCFFVPEGNQRTASVRMR